MRVPRGGTLLLAAMVWAWPAGTSGLGAQQLMPGTRAIGTVSTGAAFASGAFRVGASPARLAWSPLNEAHWVFPTAMAAAGLTPVSLRDVARRSGDVVSRETREAWLSRIEREGAQDGSGVYSVTPFAVTAGNWGLQVTSLGSVSSSLNPDAAEALLFGNAGRRGEPVALDFGGSTANAWAATTVAMASGKEVDWLSDRLPGQWAAGVVGKVTLGHAFWSAVDAGSGSTLDPLTLEGILPYVATEAPGIAEGVGVGLDIGAAWRGTVWTADLVVTDVVNTFGWDEGGLEFRRGEAAIGPDTAFDASTRLPFGLAPSALRRRVQDFAFGRSAVLAIGRGFGPGRRAAAEGSCGPSPLDGGAWAGDTEACRVGAALRWSTEWAVLRGGTAVGSEGVALGLGVAWHGARSTVELAYGRRFGDQAATGLSLGGSVRVAR